jgi:transposase
MKYRYEKRLEVVQSVLSGHESLCSSARCLHIRRWVALYEHHGEEGLRMKSGSYGVEFKLSVIRYMEANHLSLFETSVKFGIPNDSTVLQWYRKYQAEGSAGLYRDNRGKMKKKSKQAELSDINEGENDLRKELERLRAENAYLKKLRVLVGERIARESWNVQEPSTN